MTIRPSFLIDSQAVNAVPCEVQKLLDGNANVLTGDLHLSTDGCAATPGGQPSSRVAVAARQ